MTTKQGKKRSFNIASNNFFDSLTIRGFFYQPSQIFQLKFVSASDPHYVKELKVQYYFEWKRDIRKLNKETNAHQIEDRHTNARKNESNANSTTSKEQQQ